MNRKKICTCNPANMASRGLCAVHGFESDPMFVWRKQIEMMTDRQLIREVLSLAAEALDACDGNEEPLHAGDDKDRMHILISGARLRFMGRPRSRGKK